jgi:hypothetical protein
VPDAPFPLTAHRIGSVERTAHLSTSEKLMAHDGFRGGGHREVAEGRVGPTLVGSLIPTNTGKVPTKVGPTWGNPLEDCSSPRNQS